MFKCMPFLACNRQVDSLDKRQCNLDAVPEEVARYARSLEELLLSSNHIKELSKPLFRLTKLRTLHLSDNEIFKIPPEIAHLEALVELDLSKNDISDIPERIQHCKALRELNIGSNPITRLPGAITQLRTLRKLGLSDVSLTQLPADIGSLCNLQELELRENLLRSLPASIAYLAQLESLDLGANELSELPPEIGQLQSLQELYIDTNDLEWLPREIGNLHRLRALDVSENKLEALPEEIGDLQQLDDLSLSQNCLETLPHSIGKLKRLLILKLDKNRLVGVTPALGSCAALTELILTENLIGELPSSIGNLGLLTNLNMDKNQLKELPTTIGSCRSLGVLSLRENSLSSLPMEIGKLERLRVLDVSGNRLHHLPFTIGVLNELQALWLSENQSQPLLKLQTDQDSRGVKILTCYLLPQREADGSLSQAPPSRPERDGLSGPGVRWLDQPQPDEEMDKARAGHFQRQDTPHPKPGQPRNVAKDVKHSAEERRFSKEFPAPPELPPKKDSEGRKPGPPVVPPRRSLSKDALTADSTGPGQDSVSQPQQLPPPPPSLPPQDSAPALGKGLVNGSGGVELVEAWEEQTRTIHRHHGGLGLSIAGGTDSPPFNPDKPNDQGIYISKVTEEGPADRAGLKKGDKLLAVNGHGTVGVSHAVAVEQMKKAGDAVSMKIGRAVLKPPPEMASKPASLDLSSPDTSFASASASVPSDAEIISTSLRQDAISGPGFAITGGKGAKEAAASADEGIFISFITPGGSADRDGKLRVGDRLLSINGTNMKGARHDQAVALLTGYELHLVVSRSSRPLSPVTPALPVFALSEPPLAHSSPLNTLNHNNHSNQEDNLPNTELVRVRKDGGPLGMTIVGGSDHSSQPFGNGTPGVFISKIVRGSAAERTGKLKFGDRLLAVNDLDVTSTTHQSVVKALTGAVKELRLKVQHEPPPAGLRRVNIEKKAGEPMGMNICGGVDAPPANPLDPSDEGIFVEEVHPDSATARSAPSLGRGTRLLEVNHVSLLGLTQPQAAQALKEAGQQLSLLVCYGFQPSNLPPHSASPNTSFSADTSKSTTPSSLSSAAVSPTPLSVSPKPVSPTWKGGGGAPALPPKTYSSASSLPPPVAPKPKAKVPLPTPPSASATTSTPNLMPTPSAQQPSGDASREDAASASRLPSLQTPTTPSDGTVEGEKLSFGSKLRHFQSESNERSKPAPPPPPPKKIHLVSGVDIGRMKEEEEAKISAAFTPSGTTTSQAAPAVVRTKKASNRMMALSGAGAEGSGGGAEEALSPAQQRELEAERRKEWRAARLKSLESDALKAEEVLQKIISAPANAPDTIHEEPSEDFPAPPAPLNLGMDSGTSSLSSHTTTAVDPYTGARTRTTLTTLSHHSQYQTERRVGGGMGGPEIDFIDDGSSARSDSIR